MSHVLIAEDDILTSKLLMHVIESKGHNAVHAENGLIALEATEKFHFDLIFMDIQMPEMDGLDVLRRFKKNSSTSDIPVIAITASIMGNNDEEFYLNSGFSEYIFKPVYVDSLKEIIRRYLE
jgi:CheY-like chemotaxis protein